MTDDHDRKTSERRFHDEAYAQDTRAEAAKYYDVMRASVADFRSAVSAASAGADVLEYGCGAQPHALLYATGARSIRGIDISPVAIEQANAAAREAGLANAEFAVMDAEALEYADGSFDLVYGSAVVHHLDLARATPEIARVLRPGGRAIFIEPLGHNPAINLYRRRTPGLRTPDEHPLKLDDLRLVASHFERSDVRFYHFLSLAAVPFRGTRAFAGLLRGLDAGDRALFRVGPARRLAWYAVIELERPRSAAGALTRP